jgi:tetratricopeptide (TPR) repeat protein
VSAIRDRRRRAAAALIAGAAWAWLGVAAPGATTRNSQDPPKADASIADRLARVQRALFSGTTDPHEAIRDLQAILAIDEQSRDAHLLLGVAYRALGTQEFIAEAVAEFRQTLAIDPNQPPARLYLAYCYRDLGRLDRARDELQAALAQAPGNPQILAFFGDIERQLRNPTRALELARQAAAADPHYLQARYYVGLALRDLGRRDEAIRELDEVVRAGVTEPDAYLALGATYLDAGRAPEAIDVLARGAQLDPTRPDIRVQLARALRMSGSLPEAGVQLQRAAAGRVGLRLDQQQVDLDLAIERGLLRLAEGQIDSAIGTLKTALGMEPDNGPANRGLAQAYLRQGSYALAATHAARAEKAGSPLSDAERALLRQKGGR